jgi:hypothetical protein
VRLDVAVEARLAQELVRAFRDHRRRRRGIRRGAVRHARGAIRLAVAVVVHAVGVGAVIIRAVAARVIAARAIAVGAIVVDRIAVVLQPVHLAAALKRAGRASGRRRREDQGEGD